MSSNNKLARGTGLLEVSKLIGKSTTINSQTILVHERDASGNVLRCSGAVAPTDAGSGYAIGSEFRLTTGNSLGTTLYINEGSASSCDFNAVEPAGSSITGVTAGDGLSGGGSSGTVTVDAEPGHGITVRANNIDAGVDVYNTLGSLARGVLVNLSGFNTTLGVTMTLADADAGVQATHVVIDVIANNTAGVVYPVGTCVGDATDVLDTSGRTIGDLVYLSGTAGGRVYAALTGADQLSQVVGVVKVVSATVGEIVFFPGAQRILKLPTTMLQDDAVTAAKIASIDNENTTLTSIASTEILIGTGVGTGAYAALSGDVTMDNAGAVTIANDAVQAVMLNSDVVGQGLIQESDGSISHGVQIYNGTGGALTVGTLVYLSSYSGTDGITIVKADADANIPATHVVRAEIANTTTGFVYERARVVNVNTLGQTIGDAVYLDATTAGGFVFAAPTGADQVVQQVGVVKVVSATVGEIEFFPSVADVKKIGTSYLQDDAVTGAKVASLDLENTTLTNIATTEILIGTGVGTAAFAALSGDVTMTNGGVVTIGTIALETATLTNIATTEILIGTGVGTAAFAALSGDVTMTNGGVVTIGTIALETATLTNIATTEILIGTGVGTAAFAALSGDVTMTNGGVVTIGSIALETATLTNIATTEILIGTGVGTGAFAALSGDVTMTNGGVVTIAADAVNESKVADSAGLGTLMVEKGFIVVYDFAVNGGTAGDIALTGSPTIPDNALVWCDSYEVMTTLTSASDAATLTLGFATDGNLFLGIAISDGTNPWDSGTAILGMKALTSANLSPKKLTGARTLQVTVAGGENVTAGKVVFHGRYWVAQ